MLRRNNKESFVLLNRKAVNPWFAASAPRPSARLRLFCFPYAGGSASIFRSWGDLVPSAIEVRPIQLPGRGGRLHEKAFTDMVDLVNALADGISGLLDKPFAMFGHSMGAVISYELAHVLQQRKGLAPIHLFVSGRGAPQLSRGDSRLYELPEPELIAELRNMQGTPAGVLENQELLQLVLPLLRADFEVIGAYRYSPHDKFACSISAFGGIADPHISRDDLQQWCEQSTGTFSLRMFPGNHFFLHSQERAVVQTILDQLRRTVGRL